MVHYWGGVEGVGSAAQTEHQREKGIQKPTEKRIQKQENSWGSPLWRISGGSVAKTGPPKRARSTAKQTKSGRAGEVRFEGFGPLSGKRSTRKRKEHRSTANGEAQHVPHKGTIHGTKCHACHAKTHLASQPRARVISEETGPRHIRGKFPRHNRGVLSHRVIFSLRLSVHNRNENKWLAKRKFTRKFRPVYEAFTLCIIVYDSIMFCTVLAGCFLQRRWLPVVRRVWFPTLPWGPWMSQPWTDQTIFDPAMCTSVGRDQSERLKSFQLLVNFFALEQALAHAGFPGGCQSPLC